MKPSTTDRVIDALRALGGEASSAEIREKTGLGKTAVKDALARLADSEEVARAGTRSAPRYRTREYALSAEGGFAAVVEVAAIPPKVGGERKPAEPPAEAEPEPPVELGGQGSKQTGGEPASGTVSDVLAFMEEVRPLPEPEPEPEPETDKRVRRLLEALIPREPARGACGRCQGAAHHVGKSWVHDDGSTDHKVIAPREHRFDPARFATAVLKHVRANRGKEFTAVTIINDLGEAFPVAQVSSAKRALADLADRGSITLVSDRPKVYRAK